MKKITLSLLLLISIFTSSIYASCVNLEMKTGWSLVSLPVDITLIKNSVDTNTSMDRLGDYEKIYTYHEGNWTKNPDAIAPGQGFWIKMYSDHTEEFCGDEYYPLLEELEQGWNLVGTGSTLYNLNEINYIDKTFKYENNGWSKDFNTTMAGEGFWLKIGEAKTIEIPAIPTNLIDDSEPVSGSLLTDPNSIDIIKVSDYQFKILNTTTSAYTQYLDKAFFLSDTFEGIVDTVVQDGNDVLINTKDSTSIEDVYERIKFSFDGITNSQSRSMLKEQKVYNYLNKDPLTVNFVKKNTVNSRGLKTQGVFLRLGIPNTYQLPADEATVEKRYTERVSIPFVKKAGALTISFQTNDGPSYLEFAINPTLDFDYEILSWDPYLWYDASLNVANTQDFKFTLSGTYDKKLKYEFKNKNGDKYFTFGSFDIPIPITLGVASVQVQPRVAVSIGGKVTGSYELSYKNSYSETSYYNFDTRLDNQMQRAPTISAPALEYSSDFKASVSAELQVTPKLAFTPVLKVPKTDWKAAIFDVESGYGLGYTASGVSLGFDTVAEDGSVIHDFFTGYVDTKAEGQATLTGKIDLGNIPVIGGQWELLFPISPKHELFKMDVAWMPEVDILETTTISHESKSVQIALPKGVTPYQDKVKVTVKEKGSTNGAQEDVYFSFDTTKTINNLKADTTYIFTAEWKNDSVPTSDTYDKSIVFSNEVELRTSGYSEAWKLGTCEISPEVPVAIQTTSEEGCPAPTIFDVEAPIEAITGIEGPKSTTLCQVYLKDPLMAQYGIDKCTAYTYKTILSSNTEDEISEGYSVFEPFEVFGVPKIKAVNVYSHYELDNEEMKLVTKTTSEVKIQPDGKPDSLRTSEYEYKYAKDPDINQEWETTAMYQIVFVDSINKYLSVVTETTSKGLGDSSGHNSTTLYQWNPTTEINEIISKTD